MNPRRGVHAKCNFPLPEEEADDPQQHVPVQDGLQPGHATIRDPVAHAQGSAAYSEAVCIPSGEQHVNQTPMNAQV
jgi:hypothetical protein